MGWWILPGSRRLRHLVLILGRRADHHMIFIFFPYLFYHGFFIGDCSKFCVKKMKSTVLERKDWIIFCPFQAEKYQTKRIWSD